MEERIVKKERGIGYGRLCYGSDNNNGGNYLREGMGMSYGSSSSNNNSNQRTLVSNGNVKIRRFTGKSYYSWESLLLLVGLMVSLLILPLVLPPLPPPPFMLLLLPVGIFVVLLALAFMPGNGRDVNTYAYL